MSVLKYTAYDGMGRLPREEVAAAQHGRQLRAGGVLSGALHTLGYYSTDVCLGSPGRRFDLIVDTGSSITAVPCTTCRQCGKHHCGRGSGCFDPVRSRSAETVNCKKPPSGFSCERCSADRCTYSVHYTEGSAISGHVVTDHAYFTRSARSANGHGHGRQAQSLSARVFFGCQTLETGMFFKQDADGILGMQPPRARTRVPSMLSSLVQQKSAVETFSLCLSDRSGLFLLGGTPELGAMRARGGLSVPMAAGARARYTLSLRDVRMSGGGAANNSFASFNLPVSTYSPTLVDSGTTFVYASTPLFKAIHAHVKKHVPTLQREGGKVCAFLTAQQLGAMPSMQLIFSSAPSQPLLVRPQQYMVEFPRAGKLGGAPGARHYCVAVFDNQRGGTVIGASIMRQREVVFDIASNMITFVDADCDSITPERSNLKDAYAFAPCPAAGEANVSARAPLSVDAPPDRPFAAAAAAAAANRAASVTGSSFASKARAAVKARSSSHSTLKQRLFSRSPPKQSGRSTLRSVMRSRQKSRRLDD